MFVTAYVTTHFQSVLSGSKGTH